ncbi:hypothetical protein H2200_008658 [Cladophialophora chaetospira]|uniref:Uncharacterized protein n=1 Tax=Cladophialophora chaetospira TaxID=386627 RepID=A0AA38X4U2_9EURO|nr:hypothetical protein H2200_008658 [Cladophialophora chaetospira]
MLSSSAKGKRKRDSADEQVEKTAQGPTQKFLQIRTVVQRRATTQPYTIPAEQAPTLSDLIKQVNNAVPFTAEKTLCGKPVMKIVFFIQETGQKKLRTRRVSVVLDNMTFNNWYSRNVLNTPRKNFNTFLVEMHLWLDMDENTSKEHAAWIDNVKTLTDSGFFPPSMKQSYREIARPETTVTGAKSFKAIPLSQIEETDIADTMLATDFHESPNAETWFPKRSRDTRSTKPKAGPRNKKRRRNAYKQVADQDRKDGASLAENSGEEEDAEMHQAEDGSMGHEEEGDDDDGDAGPGFAGDLGSALAEGATDKGDDTQSQQALETFFGNWKMDMSVRLKSAE